MFQSSLLTESLQLTNIVQFELDGQIFSALPTPMLSSGTNVVRLALQRTAFAVLFYSIFTVLPRYVQSWFIQVRPRWCLPPTIILKRCKPGWGDEFNRELDNYSRMRSLQGEIIPWCYGEVKCCQGRSRPRKAILLSDVGDKTLSHSNLTEQDVRDGLTHIYRSLAEFDLIQEDSKVHNFHLFRRKIVAIDLEQVMPIDRTISTFEEQVEAYVNDLVGRWNRMRRSWEKEEEERRKAEAYAQASVARQSGRPGREGHVWRGPPRPRPPKGLTPTPAQDASSLLHRSPLRSPLHN